MPRKARIDAPGAIHHIMARGIECRSIFRHDEDRDDFADWLNRILIETQTPCHAWVIMPNHFHLLLRTSTVAMNILK
jgi:REP element-mobilizing transposase RayT